MRTGKVVKRIKEGKVLDPNAVPVQIPQKIDVPEKVDVEIEKPKEEPKKQGE